MNEIIYLTLLTSALCIVIHIATGIDSEGQPRLLNFLLKIPFVDAWKPIRSCIFCMGWFWSIPVVLIFAGFEPLVYFQVATLTMALNWLLIKIV